MESGSVNVKKRKRSFLSLNRKYEIVNKLYNGACASDVMKDYGIGKSTLYQIKQKKDEILKLMAETETGSGTSRKSIHKPKLSSLEIFMTDLNRNAPKE